MFFKKREEVACFCFPGENTSTSCSIEYRSDPLTARTSVICESLLRKFSILYGRTDHDFVHKLVKESRPNCFFCAPTVYSATPKYPNNLCVDGRIENKTSILFPNLFPTSALHAVLTWPNHHYLAPNQFTPELIKDAFNLAGPFAEAVSAVMPEVNYLSVNCNYMPPAGGSIIHPHFQVVGYVEPPYIPQHIIQAADQWYKTEKRNYWDMLCTAEKTEGKRWIAKHGSWSWIAPWSPVGANEVMGIHESSPGICNLNKSDWCDLAEGLHKVLSFYSDNDCSSFNFFIAGGCSDNRISQRCIIRLVTRQNVRAGYRNDEYFLQKFHGVELIVRTPESLAEDLQARF
jgi:UDPglucose--hexose-1-phosphate uridylyltransferase